MNMKTELINFWNKYQIFIWPLLGTAISVSLLVLVILPQLFKVIETNTKIEDTSTKIIALNKKVTDLKQINLTEYKNNFDKLNIVLPAEADITSAIGQVQSLTANSHIQMTGFSIALPNKDIAAESFSIKLEFAGDFSSINNFIAQVKSAPRLMTISRIDLTSTRDGGFDVITDLQTYFSQQKAALSAIEDPVTLLSDSEKQSLSKIDKSIKTLPAVSEVTVTGPKGKTNPFE